MHSIYHSLVLVWLVLFSACGALGDLANADDDSSDNSDSTGNDSQEFAALLPFPSGQSYQVIQGYFGAFSHNTTCYEYALDFDMPEDSEITAIASGRVVAMREDSNEGGTSSANYDDENSLYIDHGHGYYSVYFHMCQNCVEVEPGDLVEQGDVVAYSGNTGFSTGPHLHFEVRSWDTGCSVSYGFADVNETDGIPQVNQTYESDNSGQSAETYSASVIGTAAFDFNGVELDEGLPWELTKGETITVTGQITNGKDRAAIFIYGEDGAAINLLTGTADNSGNFTIDFVIDDSVDAGNYYIGIDAADVGESFVTERGIFVLVSDAS